MVKHHWVDVTTAYDQYHVEWCSTCEARRRTPLSEWQYLLNNGVWLASRTRDVAPCPETKEEKK